MSPPRLQHCQCVDHIRVRVVSGRAAQQVAQLGQTAALPGLVHGQLGGGAVAAPMLLHFRDGDGLGFRVEQTTHHEARCAAVLAQLAE